MKTVRLNNQEEIQVLEVYAEKRNFQGALRETLIFVLSNENKLDAVDAAFSADNCSGITIMEGEEEYIYKGFSVRCELKKEAVTVQEETSETPAVTENRIFVVMAQKTYQETQLETIQATMAQLASQGAI